MHEVCVLITTYNMGRWLGESLASAVSQRGIDFEVLIVDDGSTDNTEEVVKAFQQTHPGLVRYLHQEHRGRSAALNAGFDAADAEFVTALDADDQMHPDRARLEVEALRRFPEAAFAISCRWNYQQGSDEGTLSLTPRSLVGTDEPGFYLIQDPLTVLLQVGEPPGTCACSSRLSFSRTTGRYDEQQPSCVDGELWIRVTHNRPIAYCTAPLYFRRLHAASLSAVSPRRHRHVARAVDKARQHWADYSPETQRLLEGFENIVAFGEAKRLIFAGQRPQARQLLREHWQRLKSKRARMMYLASFLPLRLLRRIQRRRLERLRGPLLNRQVIEQSEPARALGLE